MKHHIYLIATLVLTLISFAAAQNQNSSAVDQTPKAAGKPLDFLFNYLNMAGTTKASEFRPLTQPERTHIYLKTMANPLGYIKAGFSAGIDQWKDKPPEW